MKPSGGVIAVGVLGIIVGIITGFGSTIVLLYLTYEFNMDISSMARSDLVILFKMLRVPLDILFAVILIISGIGAFMLKQWARTLALIYGGPTLVLNIIGLVILVFQGKNIWPYAYSSHYPVAGMILHLIYDAMVYVTPILFLIVFSSGGVKRQFLKTHGRQRHKNESRG